MSTTVDLYPTPPPITLDEVYVSFINETFGRHFVFAFTYSILVASVLISIFAASLFVR